MQPSESGLPRAQLVHAEVHDGAARARVAAAVVDEAYRCIGREVVLAEELHCTVARAV